MKNIFEYLYTYFSTKTDIYDNRQYWKIKYEYPYLFTIIALAILNSYENIYNVQFFVQK